MSDALTPLIERLARAAEISADEVAELITEPPSPELGDYALPCFTLAKRWRKNPAQIAEEMATRLAPDETIREARAVGPVSYTHLTLPTTPYV